MLQILNPVTPTAPIKENRNPPTIAPTIPRTMSRMIPSPCLLTILLAMKPAIRPRTIQPMMDILSLPYRSRLMPEEKNKDDDGDRYSEQPEQNAATHGCLQ